jgi:hypothetical protein
LHRAALCDQTHNRTVTLVYGAKDYVSNEGEFLAIVASEDVDLELKALSPHSLGKDALHPSLPRSLEWKLRREAYQF